MSERQLTEQESYEFWFENTEFDDHDQFGTDYYAHV